MVDANGVIELTETEAASAKPTARWNCLDDAASEGNWRHYLVRRWTSQKGNQMIRWIAACLNG